MRFNKNILQNITYFTTGSIPLEGHYIKVFYMKYYLFGLVGIEKQIKSVYTYSYHGGKVIIPHEYFEDIDELKRLT